MSKKIGIIGLGWVGVPLAEMLAKNNYEVWGTGTSEKPKNKIPSGVNYLQFNLHEDQNISNELKSTDVIIITIPPSSENFVEGLKNVISKISNKQIFFLSSTGVYGKNEGELNEKSPVDPDRSGTIKIREIEEFLQEKASEEYCILRLAGLVGPNRNPARFFSKKGVIPRPDTLLNLVHIKDVISAISFLLSQKNIPKIVNVVAPFHPSKGTFYTKMSELFDYPSPELGVNPPLYRKINSTELQNLGYQFKVTDLYQKDLYS